MQLTLVIKKALEKYPAPLLYYHDNGSWILYKRKPTEKEYEDGNTASITLAEGSDSDFGDGYAPSIVIALCKNLGIKVDSI